MRYDTIREAAETWVSEFNEVPSAVLSKLSDMERVEEVTLPSVGDIVFVTSGPHNGVLGTIVTTFENGDEDRYEIRLDTPDLKRVVLEEKDFSVCRDGFLPLWTTLWTFSDRLDELWIDPETGDGLRAMSDCGFRVYWQEDYGFVFGIDGGGYDFYTEHWIPLYKARGLKWHKGEE